jgi:hypothetical protein
MNVNGLCRLLVTAAVVAGCSETTTTDREQENQPGRDVTVLEARCNVQLEAQLVIVAAFDVTLRPGDLFMVESYAPAIDSLESDLGAPTTFGCGAWSTSPGHPGQDRGCKRGDADAPPMQRVQMTRTQRATPGALAGIVEIDLRGFVVDPAGGAGDAVTLTCEH